MTSRISWSRTSAEVPGSVPSPASLQLGQVLRDRTCPDRVEPYRTSSGEKACRCMSGRARLDRRGRGRCSTGRRAWAAARPGCTPRSRPAPTPRCARRTTSSMRQEVAFLLAVVAAERAEGAVLDAHVGEVDVAVDDVGDDVARLPPRAARRRPGSSALKSRPAASARRDAVVDGDSSPPSSARPRMRADARSSPPSASRQASSFGVSCRRRTSVGPDAPRLRARGRGPAASTSAGTRGRRRSSTKLGAVSVLGIDGEALAERVRRPPRCARRSSARAGHGALGVDVVERERRDAAPVVEAGGERAGRTPPGERLGGAWMFMSGPSRRRATATRAAGDRPATGSRLSAHRDARLGAEVLDDDLLDVAVALVQLADGERATSTRSAWRLADPDQDAGGERDAELAGERDRPEPPRRHLVGRAVVRGARAEQPLGRRSPA